MAERTVSMRADVWDIEEKVNKYPTDLSDLQVRTGHFSFPQQGFERMEVQDICQ